MQAISQSQLAHAERWITNWHVVNKDRLTTLGVLVSEARREYEASTCFPIGMKAFSPLLKKISGAETAIRHGQCWYIIFDATTLEA